jgi:hypothetical protein
MNCPSTVSFTTSKDISLCILSDIRKPKRF